MKLIKVGNQFINVERVNYWEWVDTMHGTKLVLYFSGKRDESWLEFKGDKATEVHKWLEKQAESICEEYSENLLKALLKLLKLFAGLARQEATASSQNGQQESTAKGSPVGNGTGQTVKTGVQNVKIGVPSSSK